MEITQRDRRDQTREGAGEGEIRGQRSEIGDQAESELKQTRNRNSIRIRNRNRNNGWRETLLCTRTPNVTLKEVGRSVYGTDAGNGPEGRGNREEAMGEYGRRRQRRPRTSTRER
jgi:hypothetical protein